MLQLQTRFTPADGTAPRDITIRIGDPTEEEESWSVLMEIAGFEEAYSRKTWGEDWAQAIELAAKLLPVMLQCRVRDAGGGTLEPSFYERDPQPPDLSQLPPEVVEVLRPEG